MQAVAAEQMAGFAHIVAHRLQAGQWWYGETWSILDTCVAWTFGVGAAAGLSLDAHPALTAHRERVERWPAFQRALARESAAA